MSDTRTRELREAVRETLKALREAKRKAARTMRLAGALSERPSDRRTMGDMEYGEGVEGWAGDTSETIQGCIEAAEDYNLDR